jgi:uncharacterized damage-inducible protein DinB
MAHNLEKIFVETVDRKLSQMRDRIVTCLDKLNHDQVWSREGSHENAIGNLVLHLCGNLRQWIGHGVAGRSDVRVRDREFQARGNIEPAELRERLVGAVDEALGSIRSLDADGLARTVQVQGYTITTLEAVFHVTEHFSQHAGQIILLTKHLTGEDLGFYRHLSQGASHGAKTP